MDQATNEIRVVTGNNKVFLGPYEKVMGSGKEKGIVVDAEHAVLVRDERAGRMSLVTEKQLFFPQAHETIEEVRELIKLCAHEALIVKDQGGDFMYFYGDPEKSTTGQRAFFLPPHTEINRVRWSRGRRREKRDLVIERFDLRGQYMSFEFNCRTADNVELVLEGTFFWEIVDLPAMIRNTSDTTGDICNHARSQFIRHVARVTLKVFMEELHEIAQRVWAEDKQFYDQRGVRIHSLEVTNYRCADKSTCKILEQIIQETTNRMNRLSKAESENEVALFQMERRIEQEKLSSSLLEIKHQHSQDEAQVLGTAEASKMSAFVSGLAETVPDLAERLDMWKVLRKRDALEAVAGSGASLYYTAADVDLSIGGAGHGGAAAAATPAKSPKRLRPLV